MTNLLQLADQLAVIAHNKFITEHDEPMNSDDIDDFIEEFKGKLQELSGEKA